MKTPYSKTIANRILVALFLVALIVPAALLRTDDQAAAAEKRMPAPWPGLPKTRKELTAFPRAFDAFFSDHFGLRQLLITTHSRLTFFVLHSSPSPKVILGKNNWLFYDGKAAIDGDPVADYRGYPQLTQSELERWRWMLQDQQDWLAAHGIHHLIAFVPAKEVIYSEYMPDYITKLGPMAIEQMTAYLKEKTSLPVIDVTPALMEAKTRVLCYHPHDSHWNEYGSFIGYREIMNEVAKIYPQCAPLSETNFVRKELVGTGGDLAEMINLRDYIYQHYVYMVPVRPRVARIEKLSDDELADVIATTGNTNLPRVAILRDSFTEIMVPNLSEHFETVHYQWSRTGFESSLLERVNPEMVIQIIAERAFRKARRYPVIMESYAVAHRFESSTNLLLHAKPTENPAPFNSAGSTSVATNETAWIISRLDGVPQIELPKPDHQREKLPIIRWTLVSKDNRDIYSSWTSSEPDDRGYFEHRTSPATIRPGTNVVYQALVDPAISSSILLNLGRNSGSIQLIDVEIREINR